MNLKKCIDHDTIQGYTINNPTKHFKQMFPNDYILSLDILGEHKIFNVPRFPDKLVDYNPIGYIFSYVEIKRKMIVEDAFVDVGNTFTRCLDSYFISDDPSDNIDMIIACSPKKEISSPAFTNELIIRCNSAKLLQTDSNNGKSAEQLLLEYTTTNFDKREQLAKVIRNNLSGIVKSYLRGQSYDVDSWTEYMIYNYPMNSNGLPIRYPNEINEKNISSISINPKHLFIEYDFRAKNYEYENHMITLLEDAFESPNMKVRITNTYNNILDEVKSELETKHRKYKEVDKDTIEVRVKDINDLNVSYKITDFI